MANNGNETIDSGTNCTKQTDCFVYCNIPNATNEGSSTSENRKFFHKMLKYLKRSTARIIQSKKNNKRSVSTPCKSEERIAACTSSVIHNRIKYDAETTAKIKQKMIDAITSTTRLGEGFDKVTHENLSGVVRHFVHGASYRYPKYTAKYVDNAVQERGCGPPCNGNGTQSDIMDEEFNLKTSLDAFVKACEERRHADFILEEIAKVSDALTKKARLVSVKEKATSILTSVSVTSTSTTYERGEETFESTKPLISSIIRAQEKPTAEAAATVTVMQSETLMDTQVLSSSSHFAPDSRNFGLDKSLDTPDIQVIPSIKDLGKSEHSRTVSVLYPERDDFQDTAAVTAVAREKKKEEKESLKEISLPTLNKHVNKTNYVVNCIPKLKKKDSKSLNLYQPNDIQTDTSRQQATTVKDDTIDSSIKISRVEKKPTQIAKDLLQEPVPFKKPKYRAKYRMDASYKKEEKVPQFKEMHISKDAGKLPEYQLFFSSPKYKAIRFSKSFNYFERPAMKMYQDCRSKPLRYLPPTRHCEDLISSNIYLGRPKYCDVWTTPCCRSQNEAIRNAALTHAHCRRPQDSCATEYGASCHLLVDSHASSRHCNVNNCTKRRVTFENLLCIDTYCKNDAKYCYPHLNNTDNVQMGYYHCNDSCSAWNNNQHCGRDRSCYWTKGNLYFMHPWTSEHLLRYN